MNEKHPLSASPSCRAISSGSSERNLTRAGVPVLSRPTLKPLRLSASPRPLAGRSPSLPPSPCHSPMKRRASMNVPVVSTTTREPMREPRSVTTPSTRRPAASVTRSTTVSMKTESPDCDSTAFRARAAYRALSAWARGACTAGPRERLSTRYWSMLWSMRSPISPPSASTSRTRLPLESPPIAGLQDILPMVSGSWVTRSVFFPSRARASEASIPACPPPMTMAS